MDQEWSESKKINTFNRKNDGNGQKDFQLTLFFVYFWANGTDLKIWGFSSNLFKFHNFFRPMDTWTMRVH